MVGERVQNTVTDVLGEEPVLRKIGDRLDKRSSNVRNKQSRRVKKATPSLNRRNIGNGIGIGAVESAIADVIESYVPLGSDTEIVGSRKEGNGVVYTVNTDAPFQNMAEAEAFLESGTGFTTFLTDKLDVRNVEILRTRPLRDTYQVEVFVED